MIGSSSCDTTAAMARSLASVVKVTSFLGSKIFITGLLVNAFFNASKALFSFCVHINFKFFIHISANGSISSLYLGRYLLLKVINPKMDSNSFLFMDFSIFTILLVSLSSRDIPSLEGVSSWCNGYSDGLRNYFFP